MSIYKSATHGPIPLSREARTLMQKLRDAIVAGVRVGDYNSHGQAIAHARGELATYISTLEKQTMPQSLPPDIYQEVYKAMCDQSPPKDVDTAGLPATDYETLTKRTLQLVTSHGRDRIKDILTMVGAERVSTIPLCQAHRYARLLDKLAKEPVGAEYALAQARKAADIARCDAYDRDRAMFDAGREYQRKF